MSANTTLNLGTGGDAVRTIDKAGVKTQVVTLDLGGGGAESLVSGSFPVTGTFWQATQPVSIASMPSTPVTGTFWQVTQPVSIATMPSTPVTGSFFQATQPVSGSFFQATQPVSGTFFQTTQPVSLATNTPDVTDRAGRLLGTIANTSFAATNAGTFAVQAAATLAAETTKVIGTVNIAAAQTLATVTTVAAVTAITNALPAGANKIGTVDIATAPAVAKGTQGANGVPTQDLKDSGRVAVAISCYQAAGIITTEALFAAATFSRSADGAAATTGQQFAVTTGKRFRVQSIQVGIKNTAAAAGTSKLVLRYAAAGGTITNTSPTAGIWDLGSNSVTAANYIGPYLLEVPDGMEFLSTGAFGFTSLCSAVTMLHTITMIGFEY